MHALIEWAIRGIPGGTGQRIRLAYYRGRLGRCGRNVRIDEYVVFHNPRNIELGDHVWIMSGAVLTAPSGSEADVESNKTILAADAGAATVDRGRLQIGSEVQVGHFNILNGTGGLAIGDCVTLSANVAIYSATHLDRDPSDPSVRVGANGMVRSRPVFSRHRPVSIGEGAWLGLGVSVVCASVGRDAFVQSASVVTQDVPDNAVVAGAPATYKRDRFSAAGPGR